MNKANPETTRQRTRTRKIRTPDYERGYRAGYSAGTAHGAYLLIEKAEAKLAIVREQLRRDRAKRDAITVEMDRIEAELARHAT